MSTESKYGRPALFRLTALQTRSLAGAGRHSNDRAIGAEGMSGSLKPNVPTRNQYCVLAVRPSDMISNAAPVQAICVSPLHGPTNAPKTTSCPEVSSMIMVQSVVGV